MQFTFQWIIYYQVIVLNYLLILFLIDKFHLCIYFLGYEVASCLTRMAELHGWLVGCIEDLRRFSGISAI